MVKFRLKRRISGKRIRKAERHKKLWVQREIPGHDGQPYVYEVSKHSLERTFTPIKKKRHKDFSRRYDDSDKPIGSLYSARIPRKGRVKAWKRFKKLFPQVEVNSTGGKIFVERPIKYEEPRLNPSPKKIIN